MLATNAVRFDGFVISRSHTTKALAAAFSHRSDIVHSFSNISHHRTVPIPRFTYYFQTYEHKPLVCKAAVADVPQVEDDQEQEEEDLEARAILRYCRGSPHKMRRVIDTIRGRSYEDALIILEQLPYRATEPILQTLLSAAANAKHNLGMRKTRLYVSECFVDEAPVFKRFRCRAKGRGARILKRNSHITIKVKERNTEEAKS
eukprot:g1956.t1